MQRCRHYGDEGNPMLHEIEENKLKLQGLFSK